MTELLPLYVFLSRVDDIRSDAFSVRFDDNYTIITMTSGEVAYISNSANEVIIDDPDGGMVSHFVTL